MTRTTPSFWPFVFAMVAIVAASNFLVQFPFNYLGLGELLTWGAFSYPVAFLVTDLTNRRLGVAGARKVVLAGFAIAVILSVWLATPRIAVASGTASSSRSFSTSRSSTACGARLGGGRRCSRRSSVRR